jgi:hypothetical protein
MRGRRRWPNGTPRRFDKGDPLLYIESIPYWETRGYVPIVLRNYWIYEQKAGRRIGQPRRAGAGAVAALPGRPGRRCGAADDEPEPAALDGRREGTD